MNTNRNKIKKDILNDMMYIINMNCFSMNLDDAYCRGSTCHLLDLIFTNKGILDDMMKDSKNVGDGFYRHTLIHLRNVIRKYVIIKIKTKKQKLDVRLKSYEMILKETKDKKSVKIILDGIASIKKEKKNPNDNPYVVLYSFIKKF